MVRALLLTLAIMWRLALCQQEKKEEEQWEPGSWEDLHEKAMEYISAEGGPDYKKIRTLSKYMQTLDGKPVFPARMLFYEDEGCTKALPARIDYWVSEAVHNKNGHICLPAIMHNYTYIDKTTTDTVKRQAQFGYLMAKEVSQQTLNIDMAQVWAWNLIHMTITSASGWSSACSILQDTDFDTGGHERRWWFSDDDDNYYGAVWFANDLENVLQEKYVDKKLESECRQVPRFQKPAKDTDTWKRDGDVYAKRFGLYLDTCIALTSDGGECSGGILGTDKVNVGDMWNDFFGSDSSDVPLPLSRETKVDKAKKDASVTYLGDTVEAADADNDNVYAIVFTSIAGVFSIGALIAGCWDRITANLGDAVGRQERGQE